MTILVNKDSKVVVQGITGGQGTFHATQCMEYGTQIVAGVTPGKGGQFALDGKVPIYNTVSEAVKEKSANVSLIFVPPPFAADAIMEAADAGVELIVCVTEGIPTFDMMKAYNYVKSSSSRLVGPNCPGVISPGEAKIGIMPGHVHLQGKIGVVSRSGTLTYEAVGQLTGLGIGQSTCIGIGGDPIIGTNFLDVLALFNDDPETDGVIMIGEIGGSAEDEAAVWVRDNMTKPVVGFIAGQTAPKGKRMGHAGAIIAGGKGTAAEKMKIMSECGIHVVKSPADMGSKMKEVLGL
jgi:succinyl-CoA synthetase alpha subunit